MIVLYYFKLKMLSLPQEMIIEISKYLPFDYAYYEDDEEEEFYYTNIISKEFGDGMYSPLWMLYITCKHFSWMSNYEYVCVDYGEFHSNIVSKNIKGGLSGMLYNYDSKILFGIACYHNDGFDYQNIWCTDTHYYYRYIGGGCKKITKCNLPYKKCKNVEQCQYCLFFTYITNEVLRQDDIIKHIMNSEYENGHIFMRLPKQITFDINL